MAEKNALGVDEKFFWWEVLRRDHSTYLLPESVRQGGENKAMVYY